MIDMSLLDKEIVKLSVSLKNTRALLVFHMQEKVYRVVDCSRMKFCRMYVSRICPPFCPVIVAAKDFVFGRRSPKGKVEIIDS